MKLISILLLSLNTYSAPAPSSKSNYQLLSAAIEDFQEGGTYSFELVNVALSQQTALLNSVQISTFGEVNIFLPTDASFLSLDIQKLTQNDLYTYFQYHFSQDSLSSFPFQIKTYLGSNLILTYENEILTEIKSGLRSVAKVLGKSSPVSNINIYFIDSVLNPPLSLDRTAAKYNWTIIQLLTNAQAELTLASIATDNTFFIPSFNATKSLSLKENVTWTEKIVSDIVNFNHIVVKRLFSVDFKNDTNVTTSEGNLIKFDVNGTNVTIYGPVNNATITEFDVLLEHGVAHLIDNVLLPYEL